MKKSITPDWEKDLNPEQQQIVECTDGPQLVVAGAGSGKTRIITYRIAYLIAKKHIAPGRIMALTFTNKASNEMVERIKGLKSIYYDGLWIGTFHSLFCRIMRREAKIAGYKHNFYIYDEADQLKVIKDIIERFGYSNKSIDPKTVYRRIDYAKNHLISPAEFTVREWDKYDSIIKDVFIEYEKYMKNHNALDFNDLLLKPIEIFQKNPDILQKYQKKFKYILVDEFQDTNLAQYHLVKLISQVYKNICVVGDDDQSIYGWRGAEVSNILNIEKDFKGAKIFKLEQNYRSTNNILQAAQSFVRNNRNRRIKKLWSSREDGEKITVKTLRDEREESLWIAQCIKKEIYKKKKKLGDFAVLYRTNAQARAIEEGFYRESIPYVVVGGVRFYERKEVKDVLAYLRVIGNPDDEINIKRIINYPSRGIGKMTIARIDEISKENNISFYEGVKAGIESHLLSERSKDSLSKFYLLIKKYRSLRSKISLSELVRTLVDEIGIAQIIKKEQTSEALARWENVLELFAAISDYSKQSQSGGIEGFIEKVSLFSDINNRDDKKEVVSLMTVHNAKGLEFSTVFISGLEEGLFPLYSYMNNDKELEEERRLFYVGATRAIDKLYLSNAVKRFRFGEVKRSESSKFLYEIEPQYIDGELTAPPVIIKENNIKKKPATARKRGQSKTIYTIGKAVAHEIFGTGRIIQIEGRGEFMKVLVDFEIVGKKKLLAKYAHLKVLT